MTKSKNLKEKTISGLLWSFSDSLSGQVIQFIVGLILARILSPAEFGLIGMITVFLALTQSLVDSGFGQALIRKKDANDTDFSTVFYFNFISGIALFALFYFSAPAISRFYDEPELTKLARVLGLIILINATSITQRTILTRRVNFRELMRINFIAAVISGTVAIILALNGFGVWSLVWKSVIASTVQSALLWYFNRWIPLPVFSKESFRSLFSFGSRLLLSGLIDTLYRNIYLLVIGKFFTARDLGFYTRADQFTKLPAQNITGTVQRVSYPVLSMLQDQPDKLKQGYRDVISSTMFLSFFLLMGLAAVARPMVLVLIGEKWLPSVEYLQMLCVGSMLFPLHALNLNILNVKGRSDLFLKLEIIKKLLAIPVIFAGVYLGIRVMLAGMIIHSFVSYYINAYYSGKLVNYSLREQVGDILPSFLLALSVSSVVFLMTILVNLKPVLLLTIQVTMFSVLAITLSKALRLKGYVEISNIVTGRIPFLKKIL